MNENQAPEVQEQVVEAQPQQPQETAPQAAQTAPEAPQAAPAPATPAPQPPAQDAPAQSGPDELTQARGQLSQALQIALDAEARAAAAGLGVRPDRIQYAVKLADLEGIDLTQEGAAQKVSQAIGKVLEAMPELKAGAGTGSVGSRPRQQQLSEQDKAQAEFDRGLGL